MVPCTRALFIATLLAIPAIASASDLLIRGASLVDGTGAPPLEGVSILVRAGRIAAIGPDLRVAGVPVLDVDGATVIPGLIDAHIHLATVPGMAQRSDPEPVLAELRRKHLRAYLACGVTTVLDTGIDADTLREARRWLARGEPGPEFLALGPGLVAPGGYLADLDPHPVAAPAEVGPRLDEIQALGAVGVKVFIERGFGPRPSWPIHSPEVRAAISREAALRGLPIYVHANTEEAKSLALDMGARAIVHMGFLGEDPSDAFVERIARLGTFVMTTFSVMDADLLRWRQERLDDPVVRLVVPELELATARDPESARFLARAEVAMVVPWLPRPLQDAVAWYYFSEEATRALLERSMRAAARLQRAGVPLVVGSDAGNWPVIPYQFHGPSTLREIELLVEAGLTPAEALAAATRNPARMLGLEREIGSVEVGKRADLVVLDSDPLSDIHALRQVRLTIRSGEPRTPAEWMTR